MRTSDVTVSWKSVEDIDRLFVLYQNKGTSPAVFKRYTQSKGCIELSVVIPTIDAYREGYFQKLLDQIDCQGYRDFETIIVRGDPRQGRAINIGASLARGKYLLTLDDDTSLQDTAVFGKLVRVMDSHPEIGIAGGNNVIPEGVSLLVRRAMKELPRRSWIPVSEITDSDLAEHPCMIMRTDEFKKIGGENEWIPRGLDPYLREEYRKSGKKVVVVPEVTYHHLPPSDLNRLIRQFFRNGRQSAFTIKHFPQWAIETPSTHGSFQTHVPFPLRFLRFIFCLAASLIQLKPILFLCELSYAAGSVYEWTFGKKNHVQKDI